jgi:hypothetical protein
MGAPVAVAGDLPPSEAWNRIDLRLAIVEERTRPKPKSWVDLLQAWGGAASLVVALLYSFPLGLWDRFVISRQEQQAAQLRQLRELILQTSRLWTDGASKVAGISDPQLRDTALRGVNTQLHILLLQQKDSLLAARDQLTPTELVVLAHQFLQVEQREAATLVAEAALQHKNGSAQTRVEALRVAAKLRFAGGTPADRVALRRAFESALGGLPADNRRFAVSQLVMLRSEWALLEMMDGDWACGELQLAQARATYAEQANLLADGGEFMRMVDAKLANLQRRAGQPAAGCG